MITTLHIKNIGIIDDITVDFNEGFNALTGETGAGKTLIIDALNIICGGRFSKEMIRNGENHSFVEVSIYLPENLNSIDGNIIVSREIYSNGRNSCKINGRLITVNELKLFMSEIIDIHGQNDTQKIMNSSEHISYLDNFIGNDILKIRTEYQDLYKSYCDIKSELSKDYGDSKEKQRNFDLLIYQLNEIRNANLQIGEDFDIEEKRKIILNSQKIIDSMIICDESLNQVQDNLNISIRSLEKIHTINEKYFKTMEILKTSLYDIEEANREIIEYRENIDMDEKEKNDLEERYDTINSLKRKYGNTIEEILEYAKELDAQISNLENLEEKEQILKEELDKTEKKMIILAEEMHSIRNKFAIILSTSITNELKELEMSQAEFLVSVKKESLFNKYGFSKVEFVISTNIGQEKQSLIKIASGGEISRIMLAIKAILANSDSVPIMIFDEIDTGISGKAAKKVGEKMMKIAKKHQIFVVTHLAVIAAFANNNFYIYKDIYDNKTRTNVKLLKEEETIQELARILTGEITEIAIKNAIELRKSCR